MLPPGHCVAWCVACDGGRGARGARGVRSVRSARDTSVSLLVSVVLVVPPRLCNHSISSIIIRPGASAGSGC